MTANTAEYSAINSSKVYGRSSERLDSLDILRGICAISVAVYHYFIWSFPDNSNYTNGIISVFGIYGVSIFFALSGYSLAHGYGERFSQALSPKNFIAYAKRRAGRIFPLFFLAIIASIAGKVISGKAPPEIFEILSNIFLVFGFVDPSRTPVIGGWSIGIEIVFYTIFPILILMRKHIIIALILSMLFMAIIANDIGKIGNIDEGWSNYVHPSNHILFFASGVFFRQFLYRKEIIFSKNPLFAIFVIVFFIWIVSQDQNVDEIVIGHKRIALSVLSVLIVMYASYIKLPKSASKFSSMMGGLSYPFYLFHPLVFFASSQIIGIDYKAIPILLIMALTCATAIDLAIDRPIQRRIKAVGW
ncbi:acyltransferase [Sphingomonas sp. C3-2]|uniref:acyltransferase family protein n=1 Tax=Sphingomonas sp. C3-2 TaxID=3062169 RepID=UPI00294B33F3|nr:acyltransferase [Sphingomonas sp. C3-2]WOK35098.1 acyltransferase [Sphingomonas sp. C3-2]